MVVEIGAGTGQFAIAVAPVCARVVAVDVSPVMLKALRAKIDQGQLDSIEVAAIYRAERGTDDLVSLALELSRTPCSPLYKRHVSPDRELHAIVSGLALG